jgi:hypothetical protein
MRHAETGSIEQKNNETGGKKSNKNVDLRRKR